MKILLNNSLLTPEIKFSITYADKNVINLDSDSDEKAEDNNNSKKLHNNERIVTHHQT